MIKLSKEQQAFINKSLEGKNLLVDACIGSGKTTAIQHLCNTFPKSKKILYLTYNRLLKIDAKKKIKSKNIVVTNYHGFAYDILSKLGISSGVSDLIQSFLKEKPLIDSYDVLIIDEYQDIELELASMLELIKESNSKMQIIAVGDMKQKIYDKTTLDVEKFIECFLDSYERLEFTKCFRLSTELASKLGRIWGKEIVGVNENCLVEELSMEDTIKFLEEQNPKDILCLGSRSKKMAEVLNRLEEDKPLIFNKNSVCKYCRV
ncbi:hypothetical protein P261_02547 [Lachnospiraceae bacterium TWA4]|nr:hypothetical protein P261_02547 [Lachnospiraceae bacterium TWA4]